MKVINVDGDGKYIFTGLPSMLTSSTFYFRGDAPNGAFTFGIVDYNDVFIPFENGQSDININFKHGYGVVLAVNVSGFTGTLTSVYLAG